MIARGRARAGLREKTTLIHKRATATYINTDDEIAPQVQVESSVHC